MLRLSNDTGAGTNSINIVGSGTLDVSGGVTVSNFLASDSTSTAITNSSGTNTLSGDVSLGSDSTVDVVSGSSLTLSGVIDGSADLIKGNAGTLILSGLNTFTGSVTVNAGTLLVNGSIATSSLVNVGGTLGGSGTTPSVNISSTGTLAPGNSPGIISTGDLAFTDSDSTYSIEINGTTVGSQYDQTDVTGSVTLANATLATALGYVPAVGDSFVIINNDGSDAVSGVFNGLAEGSTFNIGNVEFSITYAGGSNSNDVVLTVVGVTYTWTGQGADSNWSNPNNWDTNQAPAGGEDLVFPSGASRPFNINDLTGLSFASIEIRGQWLQHHRQPDYSDRRIHSDLSGRNIRIRSRYDLDGDRDD